MLAFACPSPHGPDEPDIEVDELFTAYGIDTSLEAQEAGYNPFGRKVVKLQARREIFFSGLYAQSRLVNIWDDFDVGGIPPTVSLSSYGSASKPAFAEKPHSSVAGDIDGDGKDDGDGATVNWYVRIDTGDVNGDGADEFVAMRGYWYGPSNTYASATYSVIGGWSPSGLHNGIVSDMSGGNEILFGNVAVGDLDGDGIKEICFSGISERSLATLIKFKVITAQFLPPAAPRWQGSPLRDEPRHRI